MLMSSNVELDEDSVNKRELGLYLELNRPPTQLRAFGIQRYCPTRKSRRGRPPNITGRPSVRKTGSKLGTTRKKSPEELP